MPLTLAIWMTVAAAGGAAQPAPVQCGRGERVHAPPKAEPVGPATDSAEQRDAIPPPGTLAGPLETGIALPMGGTTSAEEAPVTSATTADVIASRALPPGADLATPTADATASLESPPANGADAPKLEATASTRSPPGTGLGAPTTETAATQPALGTEPATPARSARGTGADAPTTETHRAPDTNAAASAQSPPSPGAGAPTTESDATRRAPDTDAAASTQAPPGPGADAPTTETAGAQRAPDTDAAASTQAPPGRGADALTTDTAATQRAPDTDAAASTQAPPGPGADALTTDTAATQRAPDTDAAASTRAPPGHGADALTTDTAATQPTPGVVAPPADGPAAMKDAAASVDAPPSTPPPPTTPHLGPFRIGPPGNFVELGFAAQLRFNLHGATGTPVTAAVELRRLRLLLRGHLLDDRLTFVLQLNTTPASLELIDAWADWRFTDALRVRVGQFKTPFTRYRQQSFSTLALADWSVFATHFGAERQLGVMLHDGGGDHAHWVYQAGVFTGVNARASFARGLAQLYGEPVTNLSDLRTFHPPTGVHPAFIGRFGHESAGVHSMSSSDEAGGGLRHGAYLSAAWDVRPSYPVDFPLRLAPELLLEWNHVFLDVVAAAGFFVDGAGAWGLASVGENVEVGWRFSPRWEVTGRYSRVDSTDAVRSDAVARAAGLIAAAPPYDVAALTAKYESAGTPRWTQEVGAALNVSLVGDALRWQTDVTWMRTDGLPRDEVRLRTQLQLAF